MEFEIISMPENRWAVLYRGYQWSPPEGPWCHEMGCGAAEYDSIEAATHAVREQHPDAIIEIEAFRGSIP